MENLDYKTSKEIALENEPVFKNIDIEKVRIIEENQIVLNSRNFNTEPSFVNGLIRHIGYDDKTINQLSKNISKEELHIIINKSFANYFGRKGSLRANIIGDRSNKKLFRLNRGEVIPYSTIFAAVDNVASKYGKITADIDRAEVRLLLEEDEEKHIEGLIKEAFAPSLLLNYSYGESLGVAKVIERLTCTNQIKQTVAHYGELNLATLNSPISIMKTMAKLKGDAFNHQYSKNVRKMQGIKASVAEYELVSRLLTKFIGKKDNDMLNLFLQKDKVDHFIRANYIQDTYGSNSLDYIKSQSRVPIDYWFLINSVTDFASHNYKNLKTSDRDMLKEKAFKLLERVPDGMV